MNRLGTGDSLTAYQACAPEERELLETTVTGVYARWHMFEEKRESVNAIETGVLPLMA